MSELSIHGTATVSRDGDICEGVVSVLEGCFSHAQVPIELVSDCETDAETVGILIWHGRIPVFYDGLDSLWKKDIRRFVVYSPLLPLGSLWSCISSAHEHLFRSAFSETDSLQSLVSIVPLALQLEGQLETRLASALNAREIYKNLRKYSHAEERDVTNQFLAPARLLALVGQRQRREDVVRWKELWNDFQATVAKEKSPESDPGLWNAELCALTKKIQKLLKHVHRDRHSFACACETMMFLLTRIRIAAGEEAGHVPSLPRSRHAALLSSHRQREPYRVLVVEDHKASWEPVFALVEKRFGEAKPGDMTSSVIVEFSADGETVAADGHDAPLPLMARLNEYDLILMDIFLKSEKNGLELLERIRDLKMSLPVIVWTSSLSSELPAQAKMANGFIFKKTTTVDELVSLLRTWCPRGRAKRQYSLMHPFFNDAINDICQREVAHEAELWALRIYASFHAQSSAIYRAFNDHAGHHILNVLDNVATIALSTKLNRDFFFSLYVGTLMHEIGMFPYRKLESKAFAKDRDFVVSVRGAHAIRGMLAVLDPGYFEDEKTALREIWRLLGNKKDQEVLRIAVIVGYHARNIDKRIDGLNPERESALHKNHFPPEWSKTKNSGKVKVDSIGKPITVPMSRYAKAISDSLPKLDAGTLDDLRKAAAILRFADALDIDRTRNPVKSFVFERTRNYRDDLENFKREVVSEVNLKDCKVEIQFAAPEPDEELIAFLKAHGISNPGDLTPETLTNGWQLGNRETLLSLKGELDDKVLEPFWAACHGANIWGMESEKRDCTRAMESTIRSAQTPEEQQKLGQTIATVSSLFVLGDLLSEYRAIEDCHLTDAVTFGKPTWKPRSFKSLALWSKNKILKKVFDVAAK